MPGMLFPSPDLEPGSTAGLENGNHTFNFLARAVGRGGVLAFYRLAIPRPDTTPAAPEADE